MFIWYDLEKEQVWVHPLRDGCKMYGFDREPDIEMPDDEFADKSPCRVIDHQLVWGYTQEEQEEQEQEREREREREYNFMSVTVQAATVNFTLPANGTKDVTFAFAKEFADASIIPVLVVNSRTNCHFVHMLTATTNDSCTYHFHSYEAVDNVLSVTARAIGKIR